jgi:hypothetical protein
MSVLAATVLLTACLLSWRFRRARYLLDGARHVMESLGGQFPITAKEMLGIPGEAPVNSCTS